MFFSLLTLINPAFAQVGSGNYPPSSSEGVSLALVIAVLLLAGLIILFLLGLKFVLSKKGSYIDAIAKKILLVQMPQFSEANEEVKSDNTKWQEIVGAAESLYASLGGLKPERGWRKFLYGRTDHISLEMVAHRGEIFFYLAVPPSLLRFVTQQIHAQYPEAHIEEVEDYNIFKPTSKVLGSYLIFTRNSAFPLKTYKEAESDPLNAITNALSKLNEEEGAAIQVLIRPAPTTWRLPGKKIVDRLQKGDHPDKIIYSQSWATRAFSALISTLFESWSSGKNNDLNKKMEEHRQLSPLEQKMIESIESKMSKAGLEVNIRIVVATENQEKTRRYLENITNAFAQFNIYQYGNSFKAIIFSPNNKIVHDFIYRIFVNKRKIILNTEELASLYHFPHRFIETPNIHWLEAKKAPPPVNLPKEGILLGKAVYRGEEIEVRIKDEDRMRHLYALGKSGVGKSVFLSNLAVQDAKRGNGFAVIDPHGDLIEDIIQNIPPERADDIIYFNPSDTDRPIGLNMLEAKTPEEADFAVQEMIAIFYKLFPPEMIGPMFEHNMRNVMLTLMANKENPGTIADIPRMFTDPAFQKYNLQFVKDPVVRSFWEKEMAQTTDFHKSEMLGYLISKVGRFVENAMMRNIIGQPRSGFNFEQIMNEGKILLVNLSKGTTGEVNSSLLGLILVSKLQMAALARAKIPAEKRRDFYLYIDEFQNFVTDSIATILSEARKYRLGLILAHQYISQLIMNNNDTKVKDAVFGNAGTLVIFRVGVEDAEAIAKELAPVFNAHDVINIEKYTAYVKLLIDNTASRPFNMKTLPPLPKNPELGEKYKQLSRLKYGRPREEVEREILKRTKLGEATTKQSLPNEATL